MKNILMLTTQLSMGGAEKVFYDHVMAFYKKYNVTVCVFTEEGFYDGYQLQCPIIVLDDIIIKNPVKRWQYRRKHLKQIIDNKKIDTCISHMEGPNFLNASVNAACKKILCAHGSIKTNPQKSSFNIKISNTFLIPFLYNLADKVVSVSEALCKEHLEVGVKASKAVTINNYFDLHSIQERSKESTELDELFLKNNCLVHVGRLAPQKNQILLLQILAFLKSNNYPVKLVVVGDGTLKANLISLAEQLGLKSIEYKQGELIDETGDVIFMGAQANPYKYMSKAKLFTLTSFNEGFPLVLGESLACGTPVVSVDCPTGPRELLSEPGEIYKGAIETYKELYCGNLVKYFDKDGAENEDYLKIWLHAINSLLNDNVKLAQLRENCFIKAAEYDKAKIIQKWFDMIEA